MVASRRIGRVHIKAMNGEIRRRIRIGENRKARQTFKGGRGIPANEKAMQRRNLPQFDLNEYTDWWDGATEPGTDNPGTLVHVAMKAFVEKYNVGAWP